jgi:hypothetical protein
MSKDIETPPGEPVEDPFLKEGYIKPVKIVDPDTGEIFIDYTGIGTRENAEKYDELQKIPVEKAMGGEISVKRKKKNSIDGIAVKGHTRAKRRR